MKAPSLPFGVRPLSAGIAIAGLALAAGLTWAASTANRNTDAKLLQLQVRQAGAVVTAALPSIQTQLGDTLAVELDTHKVAAFERFATNKVVPHGTFISISLWQHAGRTLKELAWVGSAPTAGLKAHEDALVKAMRPSANLYVFPLLKTAARGVGYADMPEGDSTYAVYAETALAPRQRVEVPKSSAFNDLNFALYFGDRAVPSQLIEASVPTPVKGLTSSSVVPFGDTSITIVGTPTRQLAGALSSALAWLALGVGLALTLATATTVEYVLRRRRVAEDLATENGRLYVEQRNIARTLQHALLPEVPTLDTLDVGARYLAGVTGIDVGGDWYDVICASQDRCFFVVGDVSGRGLGAATTMASLRFATRAYIAQGDRPAAVLAKLNGLVDFDTTQRFATVLIGAIDIAQHRVTLANAGHLPPLVISGTDTNFAEIPTATPIGIDSPKGPEETTVEVPPGGMVLAFTDGLVERRGEDLGVGLERLRREATLQVGPVGTFIDRLAANLIPDGASDDIVILGLRWHH